MTNTEKVISWAISQIGKKARDYGFNTDWCALFVERTLRENGYACLKGTEVYSCTSQMNHWKNKGIWFDGTPLNNDPCILYYDYDNSGDCDHVGIMVERTGDAFVTIEGNTSGDKWNNTSVNKIHRNNIHYNTFIRGHVYLHDIFNESVKHINTPVYYGIGYITADNTGKCQLIQHMLNVTNNAGLIEDGIIGNKTDTAIKEFQRKYNLEVDGIVGDETLFKLVQLYFNIPLENFNLGY